MTDGKMEDGFPEVFLWSCLIDVDFFFGIPFFLFENIQYTYLFRFWLLFFLSHFSVFMDSEAFYYDDKCVQLYLYIYSYIYIMYDTYLCEQCPRY